LLWLIVGVAVMAGGGYLVAALWLFPAPLLPNERQVPRLLGMAESDARLDLVRLGFEAVAEGREAHPTSPAGTVIWQDPPPGVAAPRGARVALTVSAGAPQVLVPDVRGYDAALAQRLLTAGGLELDLVDTVTVKGLPPGVAAGTNPVAGESIAVGRGVTLHLVR
jgi:serine/threonine-protein kinase